MKRVTPGEPVLLGWELVPLRLTRSLLSYLQLINIRVKSIACQITVLDAVWKGRADQVAKLQFAMLCDLRGAPITAVVNSNSRHRLFSSISVSIRITECNHSHPFVPFSRWDRRTSYHSLADRPIRSTVPISSHQPPGRAVSTNICTLYSRSRYRILRMRTMPTS